jgi:hypothetical protein
MRHIIHSAARECPPGHGDALKELAALALTKVPARGIFDPTTRGEDELFSAIESVAQAHLELADARKAWRSALRRAALAAETRDEVERTALQVQTVSDTAYFYAGLAFGLVFVTVYRAG